MTTRESLRILHVIASFAPYEGMGRVIHDTASATPDEHHLLTARAEPTDGSLASIHAIGGALSSFLLTRRAAVRDVLRAVEPEVLHFHGGAFMPLLARLRAFRSTPKILTIYSWPTIPRLARLRQASIRSLLTSQVLPPRLIASLGLREEWVRRALTPPDVIGVLTSDMGVLARLGTLENKVVFATPGVTPDDRRALYEAAHPLIVFAGRAELVRGVDVLIDAMTSIRNRIPGAQLRLLLLPRPDLPVILKRLRRTGLADSVQVSMAPTSDLRAEFASATVAVFPFRFGNVTLRPPLTIVEAMSVGLPVVTTPVDCTLAIVEDGHNGVVVPVDDSAALADAVVTLLSDEDRWHRIANGALSTVRQRFGQLTLSEGAARSYALAAVRSTRSLERPG